MSLLSDAVGAAIKITSEPAEVMVQCQWAEVWQQVTRTRAALKGKAAALWYVPQYV